MSYFCAVTKRYLLLTIVVVVGMAWTPAFAQTKHTATAGKPGGYVLERDKDVAKNEPGTHKGGGETIGYSFFAKTPNLKLVFRKRAFKPAVDACEIVPGILAAAGVVGAVAAYKQQD